MAKLSQALTIAGSDCGGGAGIQADIKTMQERGVFALSVITAITAQNTLGVQAIHLVPNEIIASQIDSIAADFQVSAFKVGMLGNAQIIELVGQKIRQYRNIFGSFVLDPVMISKSGASLLQNDAIYALKTELLPIVDIITPNLPELFELTKIEVVDEKTAQIAADKLFNLGVKTVIVKGGHSDSDICQDYVFSHNGENFSLKSKRINTRHTHGTGCSFSACITAELAKGTNINKAIEIAKLGISSAIADAPEIGSGSGPINHQQFANFQY